MLLKREGKMDWRVFTPSSKSHFPAHLSRESTAVSALPFIRERLSPLFLRRIPLFTPCRRRSIPNWDPCLMQSWRSSRTQQHYSNLVEHLLIATKLQERAWGFSDRQKLTWDWNFLAARLVAPFNPGSGSFLSWRPLWLVHVKRVDSGWFFTIPHFAL